ncbi:MAG TPA: Hpt domain-containing protein, partial [Isosphaeraceae bacterium]|nr:Hpt domain-containing protein [Isosphaeraceae bacterium]
MSGFDLSELLPFYLDETDEHIAALNDALLRLEQDPTDVKALAEAFRMFHSIKGASVVMGFEPVNRLTHHLESLFDQFRVKKRTLDRPVLDLTFRCLDQLRDYHRELRAEGQGTADLAALTPLVIAALETTSPVPQPQPEPGPAASEPAATSCFPAANAEAAAQPAVPVEQPAVPEEGFEGPERIGVTVVFEPNLPLPDMKARLVLNRLASRGRVLETRPPTGQLDEVESLTEFTVWLTSECDLEELRSLADVDGVARIRIEPSANLRRRTSLDEPATSPASASSSAAAEPETVPAASPSPLAEPAVITTPPGADHKTSDLPVSATMPVPVSSPVGERASPAPAGSTGPKAGGEPRKAKVAETIRVESDRLDYLMNLAGELVINKARFVNIAKGLEELFRGSNAQAL